VAQNPQCRIVRHGCLQLGAGSIVTAIVNIDHFPGMTSRHRAADFREQRPDVTGLVKNRYDNGKLHENPRFFLG
jgi:hypothetical protein